MDDIIMRQYLFTQPDGEVEQPTDKKYLAIANRMLHAWDKSGVLQEVPDDLKKVVCIGLIGYYQDIISDAGVWRTFIDECKRLYGNFVPFHKDSEEYVQYELNKADVEFLVWYLLAFNSMQFRYASPLHPGLMQLSATVYSVLEQEYDEVPAPHDYKVLFDCELHNPEYTETLYDLGQWLFWKNWLMYPPFQLTYTQIYSHFVEIQHTAPTPEAASKQISEMRDEILTAMPTGPLALYLREWLSLILDGKMPSQRKSKENTGEAKEHPYYTAFLKATDGGIIRFIRDYDELNRFFIDGLGWEKDEEHLPSFKSHKDFVLMVTPDKGLMVAKNIAKCIKHPANHLYDRDYAQKFAFNLISQRAVCPGDMLRYICQNGYLPDATFPEDATICNVNKGFDEENRKLVAENWDFLARAYLQEYYRGD